MCIIKYTCINIKKKISQCGSHIIDINNMDNQQKFIYIHISKKNMYILPHEVKNT